MSCPPLRLPIRAVGIFMLVGMATMAGCDPCSGILGCEGDEVSRVGGWIVERETGQPVKDVSVTLVSPSGHPDGEALTDEDGRWDMTLSGIGAEETARFRVEGPSGLAYVTKPESLVTTSRRGEGRDFGRWTEEPWYALLGEVTFRDGAQRRTNVRFRPTGGTPFHEELQTESDGGNRFFFEFDMRGSEPLVGELVFAHGNPSRTWVLPDVEVEPRYRDELIDLDQVYQVGPSLWYVLDLSRRSGGEAIPLAGVEVEFQRTGGIQVEPSSFRRETVDWGGVLVETMTFQAGTLFGTLHAYLPPDDRRVLVDTLRLETFMWNEYRSAGSFRVGGQFNHSGKLVRRRVGEAEAVGNVDVVFQRTSGARLVADLFEAHAESDGAFPLKMHHEEEGSVTGDLVVQLPPPLGERRIEGVSLETFEADSVQLLDPWAVGPWIHYTAGLEDADTGAPMADVDIEFHRTGGIAAHPAAVQQTTDAQGRFTLGMDVEEDGDLIGDLHVHLGPPRGTVVLSGITLSTHELDAAPFFRWFAP